MRKLRERGNFKKKLRGRRQQRQRLLQQPLLSLLRLSVSVRSKRRRSAASSEKSKKLRIVLGNSNRKKMSRTDNASYSFKSSKSSELLDSPPAKRGARAWPQQRPPPRWPSVTAQKKTRS